MPITRARGSTNSYHVLSTSKKITSRAYHVLTSTAFFQSLQIVLLDFSLTVKAATLIFISWCGSAISSAKEGKSGFIYNLVKS